ncbi:RNA-guided endonuclease InsQ/TnpB family protein [Nonomuraea roseoviolacea]|uniref:Transposase n=1 Tax=Nonomuraea roseoviolacea subsp. carminata TaxID=160689 RepID=A0ABT1JSJ3_9ACTN|nr:transposase [Nonomuraea roseoviolacea]MCP2344708.1 transposase [Nonomuraea roseoviolacea subsp. carminata]
MSRYRLTPTPAQEQALAEHCGHARFVWNLACEQHAHWRPGRKSAPRFAEQCRQLTEARAESEWLRAGSIIVQQQALKVGDVRRLSGNVGAVKVPKVGWVRFRWSRTVPDGVKSYRITRDRAGRWHVAFAAIPEPIPVPGTGEVVGVDRGVAVSAALSTGEMLNAPGLRNPEKARLRRLLRKLARAKRGSNRRGKVKQAIAKLKARESDRRKDWVEKTSTGLARRFDVIAVEDLKIRDMTTSAKGTIGAPGRNVRQKAGLNRSIMAAAWGRLVQRLEHKGPGRVAKVNPAFTSQRCSVCGIVDAKSRESQADFRCRSCGYACNADVNAARNIKLAAGHAVSVREGPRVAGPVHREPQRDLLLVG